MTWIKRLGRTLYRYRPYLQFDFDLGFVGIETTVLREHFPSGSFEYFAFQWYFFDLKGMFRVYSPFSNRRGDQ
jgi:hypothetical protein